MARLGLMGVKELEKFIRTEIPKACTTHACFLR